MLANLNKLGGLHNSQRVLLALVEAGASREDAYRMVQRNAMSTLATISPVSTRSSGVCSDESEHKKQWAGAPSGLRPKAMMAEQASRGNANRCSDRTRWRIPRGRGVHPPGGG
jgi:hypothetical protein